MSHQFSHTTSERRASTSIVGSLGRSGLFVPQDFISHSSKEIENALDIMDDEGEILPTGIASENTNSLCKKSLSLLSEEAKLLAANNVPIRTSRSTPDAGTDYGTITDNEEDAIITSWNEAIKSGKITTTVYFEFKTLTASSIPLVATFLLQNSLSICSIFAVSHISSEALAGITLGAMSANITAIAAIAGLASSLDTFLPQAYGAKKYHLVGLIFQRCCMLIFCCMFIVCLSWWIFAESILILILPDKEAAAYAAQYLKVASFGIPGYIFFETGKRFLQAQGIFDAPTYVLFICAPLNALMNYTFVWVLNFGYVGAPLAVSINYTLMAFGLYIYTIYTNHESNPMKCWCKFDLKNVFRNWGELIKLSIPNLIMIMSEFLSFEILTLLASYLGTSQLAAQSILATMASLTYQVPYGVSIAASTRIANFLGAQLPNSAFITCQASYYFTFVIAAINSSFLYFGRFLIANWFTDDQEVVKFVIYSAPIVGFLQIFDALNSVSAGCLRGQGLQRIGGYVNLLAYYIIGIPLGFYWAFYWPKDKPLGLVGLWGGTAVALFIVGVVQCYCSLKADFQRLVLDAQQRANSD